MSAPGARRPTSVTLLVVLTVLGGLLEVGLGVLSVVSSTSVTIEGTTLTPQELQIAGWVLTVVGLLELVLAVFLWRGANAARLLLTLALVPRFSSAWLLASTGRSVLDGALALGSIALTLYLLWNRRATDYFERREERALAGSVSEDEARRFSGRSILDFLSRLVILSLTVSLSPSIQVDNAFSLIAAVAMISLVSWALLPLLVRTAGLFGWVGALLLAFFSNAVVIGLALYITPGITVDSLLAAFVASWLYALLMTLISWVFSISTQDYLTLHAARMSMRGARPEPSDVPGVVFIQFDGVPGPLLEAELRAGNIPTISRWIRSGSHTWTEWAACIPSTTPASQAGLLHGNNANIPAFRWYDRDLGRLLVANAPTDAAVIESRISDGNGLLVDDGVSISNLFSGDAPTSLLTMSGMRDRRRGLGPSRSYAAFFTHPVGFLRAVLLSIGEMVKEMFQARRQVRRGVEPRIDRHGSYVALRAVTNVFLRDLNVALVVEAMMSGAKSIYVDFVDYDEIAHHAGVTRPESLDAFYGLDQVLASLERIAERGVTPRPYHFVLVSDHGQSQGATFRQRYGQTLEELVAGFVEGGAKVRAGTSEVETWGPVNVFLSQLSSQASVSGRLTKRMLRTDGGDVALGPAAEVEQETAESEGDEERPPLVVIGSGNLGGVWFARHPHRLMLSDIEAFYPGLVEGLASHPGVAFLVAMTVEGPVAVGAEGVIVLATGELTGTDPLTGFTTDARADFLRAASFHDAPDLYVNSLYDPVLDEVAAFEELVGCHGGLGGWQTRPMLVHPTEWSLAEDLVDDRGRLVGADVVGRQLVRWLEELGHRGGSARRVAEAEPASADPGT